MFTAYLEGLCVGTRIITEMGLGKKVMLLLWVIAFSFFLYINDAPLPQASFQLDLAVILVLCGILTLAIIADLTIRLYYAMTQCYRASRNKGIV